MIRGWVINVAVLAVVMGAGIACATVDFYNDGTIQTGDLLGNVYVWNDAVVDMTGGQIQSLDIMNFGTVNFGTGGVLEGVSAWNDSTLNMAGGAISWNLDASDSSTINLTGGEVTDWLYATDDSIVNIFGYGFDFVPDAGDWNGGQLTGFWEDTTAFSIDLLDNIAIDSTYYDHIVLTEVEPIPEPMTLLTLALGFGFVRRRR